MATCRMTVQLWLVDVSLKWIFHHQLADIADHNYGECLFRDLRVEKEIRNGLWSKIIFECDNCGERFSALTNKSDKSVDTLDINSLAVLGSYMIGIGFSLLEQFTSILDVPVMCADSFKNRNDDIGALWELTSEDSIKQAAEEERQAAIDVMISTKTMAFRSSLSSLMVVGASGRTIKTTHPYPEWQQL